MPGSLATGKTGAGAGCPIVLLLLVCAIVPQWIAPYDPLKFDYRATLRGPSWAHPFGTDNFGRDILSRVIWATRIDMQIALFATLFPAMFGTFVGCLVGYFGGPADALFRRLVNLIVTMPVLGAGDCDRRRARTRTGQHVHRGQSVGWILYGRLMRGEIMAQRSATMPPPGA